MKITYLRDQKGRPIVTIATEMSGAQDKIYFALASCHPRDEPVKKMGRNIAIGRLISGKAIGLKADGTQLMHLILNEIASNKRFSRATKQIAWTYRDRMSKGIN